MDVRTTKDGALVCMHDADVDRTTDGKGRVADLTLAQIKNLDAGAKFDARYATLGLLRRFRGFGLASEMLWF